MLTLPALLLLSALSSPARAVEIEEITVRDEAPARSESIGAEQLEQKQASDLEDAFRDKPEVLVGGGQRAAQKVYVRGLEDTNLNVTVDGARQTGYLFHHQGRLNIDVELMKKIDVEAGTGGALAGPGALGGTLRFETKDVDDLLAPGRRVGAFLKAKYHSAADEQGASLGVYGRANERTGVLLYGNALKAADYRAGGDFGRVSHTAAKPWSGLAKVTTRPTDAQKLTLSALRREDDARRLFRAHFGALPNSTASTTEQRFGTSTYSANYDYQPGSPWLRVKSSAYYSKTSLEHDWADATTSHAEGSSLGASVANTMEFGRTSVTAGLDFNQENVEASYTNLNNKETGNIYGLFAQGSYRLNPSWLLGAGARLDHYALSDVAGARTNLTRLNPNLLTRYQLGEHWTAHARWAQAFRGATPMEGFVMVNAKGIAPNGAELRGSVSTTTEAGIDYQRGALQAQLLGYLTKIEDPIDARLDSSQFLLRQNADAIRSRGVSASVSHRWDMLESRLAYSHNVVRFGGQPLGYTAFNRGNSYGDRLVLGLDYTLPKQNLLLSWNSLFALRLTRVPAGRLPQPGYAVHDLMVTYLAGERVRLSAAVNNLFNKLYVAQGTPYSIGGGQVNPLFEAGRDFRFAASVSF